MCQISIGWPSISLSQHLGDPDSRKSPRFKPMSQEPGIRSYPAQRTRWKDNWHESTWSGWPRRQSGPGPQGLSVFSRDENCKRTVMTFFYIRGPWTIFRTCSEYIEPDVKTHVWVRGPWTADHVPHPAWIETWVRISFHRLDGKKIKKINFLWCDVKQKLYWFAISFVFSWFQKCNVNETTNNTKNFSTIFSSSIKKKIKRS